MRLPHGNRGWAVLLSLGIACANETWVPLAAVPAANARTVVSIDFDDGFAEGVQAARMLEARGMRATYFITCGHLGGAGYMNVGQLHALEAAGHEIGGHSVSHPDLTALPADEAAREICDGRMMLLGYGLRVHSFAYPYGLENPAIRLLVAECGYDSARTVGAPGPLRAETIPPADPYLIQTHHSVQTGTTLAEVESWVQAAEITGGWVHLVFHRICDAACGGYSITPSTFEAILDWLAARRSDGTVVRTHHEVIGGRLQPGVPGPPPTARSSGNGNLVLNPSLESVGLGGTPDCWQRVGWGDNTVVWTMVAGAYDGALAQRVDVSSFTGGGQRLVPALDLGHCAPPAVAGHAYQASGHYQSSANPRWVSMYRDSVGQWHWLSQSEDLPPSSVWQASTFTTPPLPAGATSVSFGITLYSAGSLTVDAFDLLDLGAVPAIVATGSPADGARARPASVDRASERSDLPN